MYDTDYSGYMEPGTRTLTGADGQRFEFDPGSFCMELLLTGGPGPYQRYEILRTPADLAGWLVDSRLARMAPIAEAEVSVRLNELRQIKEFRDNLWTVAAFIARGEWPEPEQLELINQCAVASLRPELDPVTAERHWSPITGIQILGTAAREAIHIIGERASRIRECEAADCYLLFLDTSRPGNRRWCTMRRCGNRHKVKAYRSRREG